MSSTSIDTPVSPGVSTLVSLSAQRREGIAPPVYRSNRGLRIFSKLLCVVVTVLLFLGANVKSHEAGLAVPDWPTSYGYNMFTFPISYWVGGIFHEHVHRLVASLAGFLTLILAVWTFRSDKRRWVRMLTGGALLAVVVQGLLGGLTVMYRLPVWTSSMHGTLAQLYFCSVLAIAYFHSLEFENASKGSRVRAPIARWSILLIGILFAQLVFGNLMRHSEAALAVPDFPTMGGSYIPSIGAETISRINAERQSMRLPPVDATQVLLHLIHRLWAFAVVIGVGILIYSASNGSELHPKLQSLVMSVTAITGVQIVLGILVVISGRGPLTASLHVLTGALLLGTAVLLALRARYL